MSAATPLLLLLGAALAQVAAPQVSAITGNGRLTIGAGENGEVVSCRWPSPGYYNQLGEAPARWAVRIGGETHWLDGAAEEQRYGGGASVVIETRGSLPGGLTTVQRIFVHPTLDLLVAQVDVRNAVETPGVFWFSDFSPRTRFIPGLAVDGAADFAAAANSEADRIYHFRPVAPGRADWEAAEELARRNAPIGEWPVFGAIESGRHPVWIGVSSLNDVVAVACATTDDPSPLPQRIGTGLQQGPWAAAGDCQSAMALTPLRHDNGWTTTVIVAFGRGKDEIDALLAQAREKGYDTLLEETQSYWRAWLEESSVESEAQQRALLTLAFATDRATGAVVGAPVTDPLLALDLPRLGAWPTLAYDLAGRHADAERHLRFYAEAVRKEARPGAPRGSLPAALYADGTPAVPAWITELDGAACFAASLWRHAQFLAPEARRAFLESVRAPAALTANFLATWTDGPRGAPLYAFQPALLRDGRSEQTLLLCYLGIECGIRISEELGVPPETHWLRRRDDLAALIRFGVLNQETPWVLDARLPDWMREILPESHETWRRYRNTSRVVPRLWDARVGRDGNVRLLGDAPPAGEVKPSHWDARQAAAVLITAASLYETER